MAWRESPAPKESQISPRRNPPRESVRRAFGIRALATRYGVDPKTLFKGRKRSFVADLPTGPREPKSSVLSVEQEAIIVAFRRHTLLPLDDCLYALQATLPHLTQVVCIAACNDTASAASRRSKGTRPQRRSSSLTRSASFPSTSPKS